MAKIENVEVYGLERAIKTAKYPKAVDTTALNSELTEGIKACANCNTGEGHDVFLDGIIVQFDMTFSEKAWTGAQRYHWLDFVSSMSTMHKLNKFKVATMCNSYVDQRCIDVLQEKVDAYNALVELKKQGNDIPNSEIKAAKLSMLYNIPSGFELQAGMTTNYRQLKTIYQQRRHHELPDWQTFCDWCETLPLFKELCIDRNK